MMLYNIYIYVTSNVNNPTLRILFIVGYITNDVKKKKN